jgi:hypothetical protein
MSSVQRIDDLPDGEFYAIVQNNSVHIPADERSKTHPGHGYPASTEYFLGMRIFSKEDLIEEIKRRQSKVSSRDNFKILQIKTVSFETEIKVSFDD